MNIAEKHFPIWQNVKHPGIRGGSLYNEVNTAPRVILGLEISYVVGCGIESDFLIDIPRLPSLNISLNVWSSEEPIYLQES